MTGHVLPPLPALREADAQEPGFLGPFLNHEMNRCIECYRCVRFYRDYAGGKDLECPRRPRQRVLRPLHEKGILEKRVQREPRRRSAPPASSPTRRPEEPLRRGSGTCETAPSICVGHCGRRDAIQSPASATGQVRRVRTRYNGEVNGYFLCDRGRYGYELRELGPTTDTGTPLLRHRAKGAPWTPVGAAESSHAAPSAADSFGRSPRGHRHRLPPRIVGGRTYALRESRGAAVGSSSA